MASSPPVSPRRWRTSSVARPTLTHLSGSSSPQAARRALRWALGWAAAFTALHVYWGLGGRIGFGDQADPIPETTNSAIGWTFTVLVSAMFAAGFAVPLALLQRWGRRAPMWTLLVLMWTGAAVLLLRGLLGLIDGLLRLLGLARGLTGLAYEDTLGSAHPSTYTLASSATIDTIFLVGGLLFARAAWLVARRRTTSATSRRDR